MPTADEPTIVPPPTDLIPVTAAPHPLRTAHITRVLPAGMTLAEILAAVQPDPVLRAHAHIFVEDLLIPRARWNEVRVAPGQRVLIRVVAGGGGKNPLRILLQIAVVAVAVALGQYYAISASTALGTSVGTAKALISGGVLIAGTALVNAIAPIRPPAGYEEERESPNYSIDQARNRARPFAPVPVVLGKHRVVPPLGAQTYTELLGSEQYLRMLVVWGYGPLSISDLKIGETPIEEFADVEEETLDGRETDPDLTLYPKDVNEQILAIQLIGEADWSVRTTALDADEISVDVTAPQGIIRFTKSGKKKTEEVEFQIAYRKVGEATWQAPPLTDDEADTTVKASWITVGRTETTIYMRYRQQKPIRNGFRWRTPERAQYEVRLRRSNTTGDTPDSTPDERDFDDIFWTTLRSFTDENPIQFDKPLAVTALRIRATDQLHGFVDDLNGVVSALVLDWTGTEWVEQVTANPASLYRHVLQSPARADPLDDNQVDLEALQEWHEFCADKGYEYNTIRDFQGSVYDVLADIAATGRASPSYRDGKWSVTVDTGTQPVVQHFTPRNSSNFTAERHFQAAPQALRVRFANRSEGWRRDERIVYNDGFAERSVAAALTLSFASNAAASDTVQIGSTTYTFVSTLAAANDVLIGTAASDTASNLVAAITAGPGEGTTYGTGTVAHTDVTAAIGNTDTEVVLTALIAGVAGNSIAVDVAPAAAEARITGEGALTGGRDGAERYATLDAPGITDSDHIYRFARFHIAQILLRRERWIFDVDFEHLVATRGDRARLSHDVLLVGQKAARITALTTDASDNVTGIEIDETVSMVAGTKYGVSIRTEADAAVTAPVTTAAGETQTLSFAEPIPAASGVAVGDLLTFGVLGRETIDGLIVTIEPASDLAARVTMLPWSAPGVYNAETGPIPPYDSKLTPLPDPSVLVIENVRSDESTLAFEGEVLVPRIIIEVVPIDLPGARIECQIRSEGLDEPYYNATIVTQTPASITLTDVEEGETYDLRLRWVVPDSLFPTFWTEHLAHTVVGQSSAPPALTGLALSFWGENAVLLRWDPIEIIDVRIGGKVRFRHSAALSNPTWANAVSIGEPVVRENHIILPAKTGFYLARVFDAADNGSGVSFIAANSPTLLAYKNLSTLTESPGFAGTKTNVEVSGTALVFTTDQTEGSYEFGDDVDLGEAKDVRVTSVIDVTGTDNTNAWVEFRVTTDDPSDTSPTWSAWKQLDTEQVRAWGLEFRLQMRRTDTADSLQITTLGAVVDEPNIEGADGADGLGIEYIFARTATSVASIPSSQRPSNSWGYDSPETQGGLAWSDGAPDLTASLSKLWRAQRDVPGGTEEGAAVSDTWSTPKVVGRYGQDGADGQDGHDGQDGADGQDGQDGQDGDDGQDGADGEGILTDLYASVSAGASTVGTSWLSKTITIYGVSSTDLLNIEAGAEIELSNHVDGREIHSEITVAGTSESFHKSELTLTGEGSGFGSSGRFGSSHHALWVDGYSGTVAVVFRLKKSASTGTVTARERVLTVAHFEET